MISELKYSLIVIMTFVSFYSFGQNKTDIQKIPFNCSCSIDTFNGQKIHTFVEKMPAYPDGESGLFKFLMANLSLDKNQNELQTKVYLSFVIDTLGNVTNKCISRPYYSDKLTEIEKSALMSLNNMKKWTPGEQSGKKVPVSFALPIIVELR